MNDTIYINQTSRKDELLIENYIPGHGLLSITIRSDRKLFFLSK